jgi:hypothetical protein
MILLNDPWRDLRRADRRVRARRFCYWMMKALAFVALGYILSRLI